MTTSPLVPAPELPAQVFDARALSTYIQVGPGPYLSINEADKVELDRETAREIAAALLAAAGSTARVIDVGEPPSDLDEFVIHDSAPTQEMLDELRLLLAIHEARDKARAAKPRHDEAEAASAVLRIRPADPAAVDECWVVDTPDVDYTAGMKWEPTPVGDDISEVAALDEAAATWATPPTPEQRAARNARLNKLAARMQVVAIAHGEWLPLDLRYRLARIALDEGGAPVAVDEATVARVLEEHPWDALYVRCGGCDWIAEGMNPDEGWREHQAHQAAEVVRALAARDGEA